MNESVDSIRDLRKKRIGSVTVAMMFLCLSAAVLFIRSTLIEYAESNISEALIVLDVVWVFAAAVSASAWRDLYLECYLSEKNIREFDICAKAALQEACAEDVKRLICGIDGAKRVPTNGEFRKLRSMYRKALKLSKEQYIDDTGISGAQKEAWKSVKELVDCKQIN